MIPLSANTTVAKLRPAVFQAAISWSEYKTGLKIPTIRCGDLSLHRSFQGYVFQVANETAEEKTAFKSRMDSLGYTLLEYQLYLESVGCTWTDANDKLIAAFREYSFTNTLKSKASRGELTARQSTNIKLRVLYELYSWAAATSPGNTPTIGTGIDNAIQSSLPAHLATPNKWNSRSKKLFPQCYQGVGESSSSMSGQHWATVAELNDIEAYFNDKNMPRVAERNILFMRLIDQTGLRRGSANSLEIWQFSDASITKSITTESAHGVQPTKQKFRGRNFFDIPFAMAWAVNRFIKSVYGEECFSSSASHNKNNPDKRRVFVSSTSHGAMSEKTWTSIFTDAFKAIEAPIGSGLHSIRRKFAEEWFKKEVQRCVDQNLPISYTDIVAALAKVLGHESKLSQEAYRRATRMSRVSTPLDALTEQNRELAVRVMELTSQLASKDAEIFRLRAFDKSIDIPAKKRPSPRKPRAISDAA